MSKKLNKFVTTRYRLRKAPNFITEFDSKEKAMDALLEEVETPMTLEEALDELQLLALQDPSRGTMYYIDYSTNYSKKISDLKEYIFKLK